MRLPKGINKSLFYVVVGSLVYLLLGNVFPVLFAYSIDRGGILRMLLIGIFFIGTALLLILWFISLFEKKPQPVRKFTDHGSAEWATQEQFLKAGHELYKPGLWLGDGYTRNKSGHLITIAGSGAGKNACLILPNLLENPFGSYVVTDPKGENACITARNQKELGQNVYILDPWNQQQKIGATHGIPASGFNPFDFIKSDELEIRDNCELVASYLVPDNPNAKDKYWDDRARTLIKTCLMHIVSSKPENEHNFWTLYKMLRLTGDDWLNLLLDMKENTGLDGLVSIAAGEFLGMDPLSPTLTGIRSNAQNATSFFESPQLRQSLEKSDFDPYDLADGDSTVYIVIPERFLETHAAWLRLVVGLCLKAVNSRPGERVNFFLDEFAVMGKMRDVQKAFAFARGQNIVMWVFAQSLSQLKEIYNEDGMNTFMSNAAVFQAFGIKDQYTKEYISKWLGDATYIKESISSSTSTNGNQNGTSENRTYNTYGRSLLTPDEVEKYPHIITFTEGLKFWIYKIGYWQNRWEGIHWKDKRLTEGVSKIIKSGKLPYDLREHFAERADPPPRILA